MLRLLDELDGYARLRDTAAALADGLRSALPGAQVPVVGPLVGVFFADVPVTDYDEAVASAGSGRYATLFHGLLERGVAFAPGAYEAIFPSLAHSALDIDATVKAAAAAAPA